jgi:hypothetical protein
LTRSADTGKTRPDNQDIDVSFHAGRRYAGQQVKHFSWHAPGAVSRRSAGIASASDRIPRWTEIRMPFSA